MDTNNSMQKSLSNWDKPGGTLGKIVAAGAAVGGVVLLYKILPYLITLTENIWHLGILAGGLVAVGFLLTNDTFRKTFSMAYFMLMRKITGLFIEINPIAILKQGVFEMKQKIKEIEEQMSKVKALILRNEKRVTEKKKALENELLKLEEYEKRGMGDYALVTQRQVDRLTDSVKKSETRLKDSKAWYEVLTKLKERADLVVLDTENEVNDKEEEFEAIRAQHNAFKSIKSIIKGNPDEMDLFARAMEFIENDISLRLGEMTDIMDGTSALLAEMDIDDGVTAARAAEILEKYKKGGLDAIFNKSEDVKMIEGKSSKFTMEFGNETQEPVLVERENSEETVQRKYFDNY